MYLKLGRFWRILGYSIGLPSRPDLDILDISIMLAGGVHPSGLDRVPSTIWKVCYFSLAENMSKVRSYPSTFKHIKVVSHIWEVE